MLPYRVSYPLSFSLSLSLALKTLIDPIRRRTHPVTQYPLPNTSAYYGIRKSCPIFLVVAVWIVCWSVGIIMKYVSTLVDIREVRCQRYDYTYKFFFYYDNAFLTNHFVDKFSEMVCTRFVQKVSDLIF